MGFQIENGVLVKYTEEPGVTEVVIPDGVTSIGKHAFSESSNLTNIIIPDGVSTIGSFAFSLCEKLTNISIPDSVTTIDSYAFHFCQKLEKITIPCGVNRIGKAAFSGCYQMTDVCILGNITSLEEKTFSDCGNLTNVRFPNSIVSIAADAFEDILRGSIPLKNVDIPPEVWKKLTATVKEKLITDYGIDCYLSEDPDQCDNMRTAVLHQVNQKKRKAYLLDHYSKGTDAIKLAKLLDCLKIAPSVEEISQYIEIGTDPAVRAVWLKYQDTHYSSADIERSNSDIMDREMGLRELTPAEWRKIYQYSAVDEHTIQISGYRGGETYVIIPSVIGTKAVTYINDKAFYECSSLTGVMIPDGVTYIGKRAFAYCSSLTSVTIPNSVTHIGEHVFIGCHLKELRINTPIRFSPDMLRGASVDRIIIENPSALPNDWKPIAAATFAEEGADISTARGKNHMKYIKANAEKLKAYGDKYPKLLELIHRIEATKK